ncbi:MAG: hypothetical protein CMJ36_01275 [Phycisphaerae bacterium]|nr:hypothetical protein [Phycisphaerae bacterium]
MRRSASPTASNASWIESRWRGSIDSRALPLGNGIGLLRGQSMSSCRWNEVIIRAPCRRSTKHREHFALKGKSP